MAFRTNKVPVLQEKSASGSVATFNTALAMPLVNGEFSIQAYQEGSGDPAPDNVRNIIPFNKLRIGMVNFNQITRNGNFSTLDGWGVSAGYGDISVNNNECVYTFTIIDNSWYQNSLRYGMYMIPTHKYFFSSDYYVTKPSNALIYNIGNAFYRNKILEVGWNRVQTIMNATFSTEGNKSCYIGLVFCENYNYQVGDTYKMKNVMCFDLTQLFGSRIADYLYNLESNQEGAGVAIFKQLFYKDYYDYNVGGTWVSVASVNGDSYPDYAEVALGEEVFGGSYNSASGKKIVNKKALVFTGNETWSFASSTQFFYTTFYGLDIVGANSVVCTNGIKIILYANGICRIYISDNSQFIDSTTDMNTIMTNGIKALYNTTPIETDIGSTPIETLIGNNTIFADTGDVDLTYKDLDIAKRGNFREVFKLPS